MNRWRNCSTAVSSDGQRAKIPHNYRGRPSFTSVSFSFGRRGQENDQRQLTQQLCPWVKSIKELSILSWTEVGSNLYQPRKTIRVSEILKMNPTLRYFLSLTLKLATNQFHTSSSNWYQGNHSKGTLIKVSSRVILTQRRSHGDQHFPQYFYNCNESSHKNFPKSFSIFDCLTFNNVYI